MTEESCSDFMRRLPPCAGDTRIGPTVHGHGHPEAVSVAPLA